MLTNIYPSAEDVPRDPRLEQINALIDVYNEHQYILDIQSSEGLQILQKIDAMTSQIQAEIRVNPDKTNNEFAMWLMQDTVHKELSRLSGSPFQEVNSKKLIMELSDSPPEIPSVAQWKRATTPVRTSLSLGAVGHRSSQYKDLDKLIYDVKVAESHEVAGSPPSQELMRAVEALQEKLVTMEIPSDKPKMAGLINDLLGKTNSYLNMLIEKNPAEKANYGQARQTAVINPDTLRDRSKLEPLVLHLTSTRDGIDLGDFQAKFLGGRNNLNWLASNPETEERFVIW